MILGLTGGTGFVGGHLIDRALAAGHRVKAIARREQPPREGLEWLPGGLDEAGSLAHLVDGVDAVIHVAGIINAATRDDFFEGNVAGTQNLIDAALAQGMRRFIHVSSLAVREPQLSIYGASKAGAERLVEQSGLDWTIIRPPAVYGPGDRETLELFRLAGRGLVPLPPGGRFSVIEVGDLADLLLAVAGDSSSIGKLYEPDDATPGGWDHPGFTRALGTAMGVRATPLPLPRPLLMLAARGDKLFRGDNAKLTPDRVRYFCHPDWVSDPDRKPPPDLWSPAVPARQGLAETAAWYRREGWL